ncbi:MAG: potassium/proton antiporter [Solirubrobacterales bacterium]
MSDANLILIVGGLLIAGLLASVAAGRLRVPGLVLFLGLGMAIGSDGTGWIDFSDYELARTIGIIALALILFEGGLNTGFSEIRPVLRASLSLALPGTLLTAAISGVAATWLFDLSLLEGMLLGSIVSVTDGAAIFGLLRDSTLRRRVARTLEGEAGLNDPVAVLLVVGLIDWIQLPDYGLADMVVLLFRELGIGLAVGLAVGWLAVQGLRRARLGNEAGYAIGTIGVAAVSFGAASSLHGSGFLAVYVAGLWLGSVAIPAKPAVTVFHQGLALVAEVAMFVVLGLLVFPSQLGDVALEGTVLALVVVFLARPVATLLSTAFGGFTLREQSVLSWAGLRGAVPVVLATFPVIEGVPGSLDFFNIVFFAVLLSTLLQGATFEPFARALGVTTDEPSLGPDPGPPRSARASAQILTVRPWKPDDGNPAFPKQLAGTAVTEHLLTRLDLPGALVALADGRYAFTGSVLAIGSNSALQATARRRLAHAGSDAERTWWREVIGALAR